MTMTRDLRFVRSKSCEVLHIMPYVWVPIPSLFTFPFIPARNQESVEETMAPLNRYEISGSELIEANEEVALRFEKNWVGGIL